MKKIIFSAAVIAAMSIASNANAQLVEESNVTVTMDLQPILQLNMNGPQNLNFVFDQIPKYVGGITQYGATQLQVSSTINWDLYAVGFASNSTLTNEFAASWDQQVKYGVGTDANAVDNLPITLLELHQDKVNPSSANNIGGNSVDYSNPLVFSAVPTPGLNSIYACGSTSSGPQGPYQRPTIGQKYIVGDFDPADFYIGGSYLITDPNNSNNVGGLSNFYYSIDYRIRPGLPATFPNAGDYLSASHALDTTTPGTYARPGVYTMNVKYVVIEN